MNRPVAALPCWLLASEGADEAVTRLSAIRQAIPRAPCSLPLP